MKVPYVGLTVGLWYLVAPFVWGYPFGFLVWQDLIIGAAIIAISLSYTMGGSRLNGWLLIAVGAYSMFAPFIHDYLIRTFAFWNDLVFGVVTVGTGVALGAAAIAYGEEDAAPV